MTYILGVDCGTTRTLALIARLDGTILGMGRSGGSDIYIEESPEAAIAHAVEAVSGALNTAKIEREALVTGCFSIAGADWREDYEFLQRAFTGFGEKLTVVNDTVGALRAASPDGTGVVVICSMGVGTGARNAAGDIWHSSFWQEPQGTYELGQKTLRAVYRAALNIDPPTTLTNRVLEFFGKQTAGDLLYQFSSRLVEHPGVNVVAGLAGILFDEANNGDGAARQIVETQGAAFGDYVLAAARQVKIEATPFPLVLTGEGFRHSGQLLAKALIDRVHQFAPQARPISSRFEPVIGALLLALDSINLTIDERLLERLSSSLPPASVFET